MNARRVSPVTCTISLAKPAPYPRTSEEPPSQLALDAGLCLRKEYSRNPNTTVSTQEFQSGVYEHLMVIEIPEPELDSVGEV